ncbi:MAG: 4Fe-4S ferredoxin [Verrucomicrobia bacterium]|nr:4Fe-4S ferredoxin [Verrucomicrobiota bacterium]
MKREIVVIDEKKCTGCAACIPNCKEGALQIIDGKARLISDLFCDGLGACLGHCPEDAITIVEREAEPYDERTVMKNVMKQGKNTIKAHMEHLKEHKQHEFLAEAVAVLKESGVANPLEEGCAHGEGGGKLACGCPGSMATTFAPKGGEIAATGTRPSELTHWPLQLHLISPLAPQYKGKDVLLSADCVAYSLGDFHKDYLKNKALCIACPKLDEGQDEYKDKITALIDEAKINTLTVMIMEVPCCHGLLALAQEAASKAKRKVPIKCMTVSRQGEIADEQWV